VVVGGLLFGIAIVGCAPNAPETVGSLPVATGLLELLELAE
jgi:hypothetical protein